VANGGGVNARVLLAVAMGLGVGVGLVAFAAAIRGTDPARGSVRAQRSAEWLRAGGWINLAAGLLVGVLVVAVTGWIAVSIALAVLVVCWKALFGGAKQEKAAMEKIEALAAWTESLRDTIGNGGALAEALPASVPAAAPVLRPYLLGLVERMGNREPISDALIQLAADLDDANADLTIAALALTARAQGKKMPAVLTALAQSSRSALEMRRTVEADRRSMRRGMQIILGVVAFVAIAMSVFNRAYVQPYHTAAGQLILAIIVGIFAASLAWMRRLANYRQPQRFLADPAQPKSGAGR
jgi:hypothetical protein